MTTEYHWNFRAAEPGDINFIYSSWLRSYQMKSSITHDVHSMIYFDQYKLVIDYILTQPNTIITIACLPEDPSVILGYIVASPPVLHYVYVKEAFWRQGIAASLVEPLLKDLTEYSHQTIKGKKASIRCVKLSYNPFTLFHREQGVSPDGRVH